MSACYYRFYAFTSPQYAIAWNSLLAKHTLEQLPRDTRLQVLVKQYEVIASDFGLNPEADFPGGVYYCFTAFAMASLNILPKVEHGSARWYPVQNPLGAYALSRGFSNEIVAQVQRDIQVKHGTLIDAS